MSEIEVIDIGRRPRIGRPDQRAAAMLHRNIVHVASRLFAEQGYLATSIEQIAAEAGSGKQTIYRRFGTKQGVLIEAINMWLEPVVALAKNAELDGANPLHALRQCCQSIFDFMLTPEIISLHRTIIAETHRFPKLRDAVMKQCAEPLRAMMRDGIRSARDAGLIRSGDDDLDQALLVSLFAGWPTQQMLLGVEPFGSSDARASYFEAAWNVAIEGIAIGPTSMGEA